MSEKRRRKKPRGVWDGKVKRKENEEREPPQLDAGVGESVSVGNWLITDDRGCNDPLEGFFPLPYTHTHGMFVMEDRGIEEEEEAQPTPSHLLLRRYTHEHRERKKMAVSLSLYIQRNIERSKNTTTPSVKIRFFFQGFYRRGTECRAGPAPPSWSTAPAGRRSLDPASPLPALVAFDPCRWQTDGWSRR